MKIKGKEYTEEELIEAANLKPYTWVLQNKITTETGVPLTFEKRS